MGTMRTLADAPAAEPREEPAPLAPPAPSPASVDGHASAPEPRARVLVVDDDERNLLAIRTVIEDLAEVETASSGEEALRQLLKGEFAVILLDVYMPGMDGYEAAEIIRGREQTKRIPIVFLSAINKEKEHLLRGYAMGAVDYVFKPVEPLVLRSKVAVFVDLYAMTREIRRKAEQEQKLLDENLRANAERLRIEQELRLWGETAGSMLRHIDLPRVEARLVGARVQLDRAAAARDRGARVLGLLLAGSELVETTPRFVARAMVADADRAVGRAVAAAADPEDPVLARAVRLKDWAARAVEEGDDLLAIQRAYYAMQLVEAR